MSLSPYYSGSYSLTYSELKYLGVPREVSVLIIPEVTLWQQKGGTFGFLPFCLSPYYSGSYSLTLPICVVYNEDEPSQSLLFRKLLSDRLSRTLLNPFQNQSQSLLFRKLLSDLGVRQTKGSVCNLSQSLLFRKLLSDCLLWHYTWTYGWVSVLIIPEVTLWPWSCYSFFRTEKSGLSPYYSGSYSLTSSTTSQ